MTTKLFSLLFVSFLFTACHGQTQKGVQTIEAKTFSEKLKSTDKPQLVDVRTPEEYASEHLDNAQNINWNGDNFVSEVQKLDKTKPIFVYCKVGGRSGQAANKLTQLGFTEVYNLDGGIMKWNAAGLGKPSGKIIGICPQEFDEMVKADQKLIVNFYAKWCEPCKKMEPYLLKMQAELKGKTNLVRLNADENKTILETMKFDELPVILIYENGKETWRHTGYLAEEELRKHL